MRRWWVLGVLVAAFGCDDCSERAVSDRVTLSELKLAQAIGYASSWDAGVAEVARLEAVYAPLLEVRADTVGAWAGVPDASVTAHRDDGLVELTVRVPGFAEAGKLVGELQLRGAIVDRISVVDGGVEVEIAAYDLEGLTFPARPAFTLAPADAIPCLSSCQALQKEVIERRTLIEEFDAQLPRLRKLRRLERWRRDDEQLQPSPRARETIASLLDGGLREGSRVRALEKGQAVSVCGTGLRVEDCARFGADARCVASRWCAFDAGCEDPSVGPCGFEVRFGAK
ncbi:MAG: hypothetical protein U0228_30215 [Myxococcaceae bacterium]